MLLASMTSTTRSGSPPVNRPSFFSTVTPGQFPICCRPPVRPLKTVVFPQFGFPATATVMLRDAVVVVLMGVSEWSVFQAGVSYRDSTSGSRVCQRRDRPGGEQARDTV